MCLHVVRSGVFDHLAPLSLQAPPLIIFSHLKGKCALGVVLGGSLCSLSLYRYSHTTNLGINKISVSIHFLSVMFFAILFHIYVYLFL